MPAAPMDDSMSPERRQAPVLLLAIAWTTAAVLPLASPAPVNGADDTLKESKGLLRRFPFTPDCNGNTKEMVACLWQRRNQDDTRLERLLGDPRRLEEWRASRRKVCEVAADKTKGGSVHPIVWLSCENALTKELLRQITRPLLHNEDL